MRFVTVLTICLALAGADAAFAAPIRLTAHRLGAAPWVRGSDGARFAAWPTPHYERTTVYDARTNVVREIQPPPGGCSDTAIGAGALVYTCYEGAYASIGRAQLLNLRTGSIRQVVGNPPAFYGQDPGRSFDAVGRYWIQATMTEYHGRVSAFYSRATGERYDGPAPFGPHTRPDLDSPALRAAICSPLAARRIPPDASEANDGYRPLQIEGSYALDVITAGDDGQTRLVLHRCGTRRHRIVCQDWCFSPLLEGGQVLWADDNGVLHVLDVRARRARTYRVPGHPISAIYPTGKKLVLATDAIAGTVGVQVRVADRPRPARARRTR